MEAPIEQTKSLKDKCPTCGNELYAYWHTPASDHPECGSWYVECANQKCKHEHDDCFPNLEWLSEKFNIINK